MITFNKPKKGFDASIEVRGSIFQLKNVVEKGSGFTHIDISDETGKFIDEFALGFKIDLDDESDDLEMLAIKTFEYINDNLVF